MSAEISKDASASSPFAATPNRSQVPAPPPTAAGRPPTSLLFSVGYQHIINSICAFKSVLYMCILF